MAALPKEEECIRMRCERVADRGVHILSALGVVYPNKGLFYISTSYYQTDKLSLRQHCLAASQPACP
jgi:hypothetical protein